MGRGIAKTAMLLITTATVMMLINGIASETFVVGGDGSKWSMPSSPDFYETWAAQHNFTAGDVLGNSVASAAFDFETDSHTVAMFTLKQAYEECNANLDNSTMIMREGPLNVTLTSSGQVYFLCDIDDHCKKGLKFGASVA